LTNTYMLFGVSRVDLLWLQYMLLKQLLMWNKWRTNVDMCL